MLPLVNTAYTLLTSNDPWLYHFCYLSWLDMPKISGSLERHGFFYEFPLFGNDFNKILRLLHSQRYTSWISTQVEKAVLMDREGEAARNLVIQTFYNHEISKNDLVEWSGTRFTRRWFPKRFLLLQIFLASCD